MAESFGIGDLVGYILVDLQVVVDTLSSDREFFPSEMSAAVMAHAHFAPQFDFAMADPSEMIECDVAYAGMIAWATLLLFRPEGFKTKNWHVFLDGSVLIVSRHDIEPATLSSLPPPSTN